jgi:hypothetical protein
VQEGSHPDQLAGGFCVSDRDSRVPKRNRLQNCNLCSQLRSGRLHFCVRAGFSFYHRALGGRTRRGARFTAILPNLSGLQPIARCTARLAVGLLPRGNGRKSGVSMHDTPLHSAALP